MMLKKALLGCGFLGFLGVFLFGRDAVSYARTGCQNVRNAIKAEVPVEFEAKRARTMVEQLVPDIRSCMHAVAEQKVDIEHLRRELALKETEAARQKENILALRTDLGTGGQTFTYASHLYSANDVKRDLALRFERLKTADKNLAADRQILSAREQTLAANCEKLDAMMQAKKDLELKLEQLEARIQTVKAAETVSRLSIDDSNLSHARRLITDLNRQLDVKQRALDIEGQFVGLIPVEKAATPVPVDLDKQIDAYFDHSSTEDQIAVK